jgi:putative Mg2+ transporter-C (MgtC) family protein
MITGLPLDLDLILRLVVAAALGAGVGAEREIHGHPAGMRTHLLVCLGSALFTVISIHGFVGVLDPAVEAPVDPSRVAAQIVSGIGFLGAGAILKDGFTIRGLTTAASLWATAAIGLAAGAGEGSLAVVGTLIVVFSLWPLSLVSDRLRGLVRQTARIRVVVDSAEAIERARAFLDVRGVAVAALNSERVPHGLAAELTVELRTADLARIAAGLTGVEGVLDVGTGQQD